MATPNERAGILNTLAVIPLGQKRASADYPALVKNLGMKATGLRGERYCLVQLDDAGGMTAANAARAVFKQGTVEDDFDVTVSAGATDVVQGVGLPSQVALVDNDIFWIQTWGRCKLNRGTDGTGIVAGDQIGTDADAGVGHVKKNATFLQGTTLWRALTAAASAGDEFTAVFLTPGAMDG